MIVTVVGLVITAIVALELRTSASLAVNLRQSCSARANLEPLDDLVFVSRPETGLLGSLAK